MTDSHSASSLASTNVVLGGVVLVAAGMLLAIFNAPGLSLPPQPPVQRSAKHAAPKGRDAAGAERPAPVMVYTAETLRDPMASLLPKPEAPSAVGPALPGEGAGHAAMAAKPVEPKVQGLVWGGGRAQALIDGELYDVGQIIGPAKILAITRDGVTVSIDGKQQIWQPVHPLQLPATLQGGQP